MRCPKCGGRTVRDDFHTYMGQELQLKCIACGKLFMEAPAQAITSPAVEELPQPSKQYLRLYEPAESGSYVAIPLDIAAL